MIGGDRAARFYRYDLYSFSQGRQYFIYALTKSTETERKGSLARMFRTLGDVIHVVQDMAQPQHTRNDGHGFPTSVYEANTNLIIGEHRDQYAMV